jgi:two-component system response regulator FixJ
VTKNDATVYIVDDDDAVRDSLMFLLQTTDIPCQAYASAEEFIGAFSQQMKGCMVLDIRMPGVSGMELQKILLEKQCQLPIIFVTGHGDVEMAVEAMRLGAFDFIQKPFHDQELLDRISHALDQHREGLDEQELKQEVSEKLASLTAREREVMNYVVAGHANKVIAMDLDLSQRTVEVHRARVMEKMKARSLAELVRMVLLVEN